MKKWTKEEISDIIELYNSGQSCKLIAQKYNCTGGMVQYQLKKQGLTLRSGKGIKHSIKHRVVELDVWKSKEGTPDFDYFIGMLASDGCIVHTCIALELKDKEILDHYNSFLGNVCNINSRVSKVNGNIYYNIKYKNEDIVEYLKDFGIVPRKTNTLKLKYINWNVLRGIFDGDGSIMQDPRTPCSFKFQITSGSIEFIEQLEEFYNSNGISYYITEYSGDNSHWYNITVGQGKDIFKIYENMYKDTSCYLSRKHDKFGPLVEKFTRQHSVNSVNGRENQKTEPSLNIEEGAETRNGEPKSEISDMVNV